MYGYKRVDRGSDRMRSQLSKEIKVGTGYIADVVGGYRTLNIQGRETLPNTVDMESLRYRGVIRETGLPSRTIKVQYQLKAQSSTELLEKFKQLRKCLTGRSYFGQELEEFTFADEEAFYYGYLSEMETLEAKSTQIMSSFTLLCPEPWKYGELVKTNGDVTIDTFYPTVPERVQVNVTQTTNQLEIKSGEYTIAFDLQKTVLNQGEVVRIFPKSGEVYVGDKEAEHLISLTSDFQNFEIKKGQRVTASTGNLTLYARERWL